MGTFVHSNWNINQKPRLRSVLCQVETFLAQSTTPPFLLLRLLVDSRPRSLWTWLSFWRLPCNRFYCHFFFPYLNSASGATPSLISLLQRSVPLGGHRHCAPLTISIVHPLLSGTLRAAALPYIPDSTSTSTPTSAFCVLRSTSTSVRSRPRSNRNIKYTPRVASIFIPMAGEELTGATAAAAAEESDL